MLDLPIKNARICDGTGGPSFMGDVGVQDGLIRSVGKGNGHIAERVLDAEGLALARASSIPTAAGSAGSCAAPRRRTDRSERGTRHDTSG